MELKLLDEQNNTRLHFTLDSPEDGDRAGLELALRDQTEALMKKLNALQWTLARWAITSLAVNVTIHTLLR
jgi:hypothetical protein